MDQNIEEKTGPVKRETRTGEEREPETETEAGWFLSDSEQAELEELAENIYTEEMQEEINSMSAEEIGKYALQIKDIVSNPDFQALFEYEEVRELAVMLVHNAVSFSAEDPELTEQILETLGIDRRAILVFFALLQAHSADNRNIAEGILAYLESEDGQELVDEVLDQLNDKQTQAMLQDLAKAIQGYSSTKP